VLTFWTAVTFYSGDVIIPNSCHILANQHAKSTLFEILGADGVVASAKGSGLQI
jgi:hypothetical protein